MNLALLVWNFWHFKDVTLMSEGYPWESGKIKVIEFPGDEMSEESRLGGCWKK